ncbi:MAG: helix-turn-helix domain-containing protein [Agathobacter sp.]|nr:helix-turn-helix domain-containing protein [Agathobacter sp.]
MEKKTIGQFIAVLRKANGLTQQELADKLNVSNKAVSRWERDESAPDITLIPALAEILGVTCDELLKGERITYSEQVDKREAKVEKQVKSLIQREISKYRIILWIALALVVVGFVMPFVLAPSPDVPEVICWVILILSQIVAFIMVTIAVAQMRDIRLDSEMFENADAALVKKYDKYLGDFSYLIYYLIAAVVFTFYLLFTYMMPEYTGIACVIVILTAGYWLLKGKYVTWITGAKKEDKTIQEEIVHVELFKNMNRIQIGTLLLYAALFFFAPYFEPSPEDMIVEVITAVIAICLLLANVISAIAGITKEKENRKKFIFYGVRNILLLPSAFLLSQIHSVGWGYDNGVSPYKYEYWYPEYLVYTAAWALGIIVIFYMMERKARKK